MDDTCTLGLAKRIHRLLRVIKTDNAHPDTVEEDASAEVLLNCRCIRELLHRLEARDVLTHDLRVAGDTDDRRRRHILYDTNRVPLRRLSRANLTPLRVVQLAGRNELTCLLNRRARTAKMRE